VTRSKDRYDDPDPDEHTPYYQLRAFETALGCLTATLVVELAGTGADPVEQAPLQQRWAARWPALTHGIGHMSVAARVERGLRLLSAAEVVRLDPETGAVTIVDPDLLAMSAGNAAIVARPDGCRIRPRNWQEVPVVPEHLWAAQQYLHSRRSDGTAIEPGPLGDQAQPGYGLAVRSREEFTGTVAVCDASLREGTARHPPHKSGGLHLGMAFLDNHGGWWIGREYFPRSARRRGYNSSFAELVAASAAIVHHPNGVHVFTDHTPTRDHINLWRHGENLFGPRRFGPGRFDILTQAATLCAENPDRFTVAWVRGESTPQHATSHKLSRLMTDIYSSRPLTLDEIKARATELVTAPRWGDRHSL
jgi:hypothetical protein